MQQCKCVVDKRFFKFIYSEKATKYFAKSSPCFCSTYVKRKVKILQNFVAFSEYMNFTEAKLSFASFASVVKPQNCKYSCNTEENGNVVIATYVSRWLLHTSTYLCSKGQEVSEDCFSCLQFLQKPPKKIPNFCSSQ